MNLRREMLKEIYPLACAGDAGAVRRLARLVRRVKHRLRCEICGVPVMTYLCSGARCQVHMKRRISMRGALVGAAALVLAIFYLPSSILAANLTLAWDASPDPVDGYTLCWAPSDVTDWAYSTNAGAATNWTLRLPAGQYDFWCKAFVAAGGDRGTNWSQPSRTIAYSVPFLVSALIEQSADLLHWTPLTNTTVAVLATNEAAQFRARMKIE